MVGKAPAGERGIRQPERLRAAYDVVIIGAGIHGLAAAYSLARMHGIRSVAVLEQGCLGGSLAVDTLHGGHYSDSPLQDARWQDQNARLWRSLPHELDSDLHQSPRSQWVLAHCDASLRDLRWRCEVKRHQGVPAQMVDRAFLKARLPALDLEGGAQWPIVGALYTQSERIADHEVLCWAYARAAERLGVEIHEHTEVFGIDQQAGAVVGVRTTCGRISTPRILCAVEADTPRLVELAGLRIPLRIQPVQALICEPMQQWLAASVASTAWQLCLWQTARGELVVRADPQCYELQRAHPTLELAESLATGVLELFPGLGAVQVASHWAGLVETTPDGAPLLGSTPLAGFYLNAGWGALGLAAAPLCGVTLSHSVATGHDHPLIEHYTLERFARFEPSGEYAAAAI